MSGVVTNDPSHTPHYKHSHDRQQLDIMTSLYTGYLELLVKTMMDIANIGRADSTLMIALHM
jgi:hypothetical protein